MKTLDRIDNTHYLKKTRGMTVVTAIVTIMQFLFSAAIADESDHSAAVSLEADFVEINEQNQEATFQGNVTLRQGTLEIHADKIVVKRDGSGFQHGKATGNPAHFRQKREGMDEHIDGYATRIEYDGLTGQLEMFEKAKIIRGPDKVEGDYISYNMETEFFQIKGGGKSAGTGENPNGRVRAVIQPKSKD